MNLSKSLFVAALSLSTVTATVPAQADNTEAGAVIGAILGGVLGAGASDGDAGTAIVGAIVGGALGAVVGNELDDGDRRAVADARSRALRNGGSADWDGRNYRSRTGANGRIAIIREGYHRENRLQCREYRSEVRVRGRVERTTSQACVDRYGNWTEVNSGQVVYGGRGRQGGYGDDGAYGGHGGYAGYEGPVSGYPYPDRGGYQHYQVSDRDVQQVIHELRAQRWDSDRNNVLQSYVNYWNRRGQRMTSRRLPEILALYQWDSDRLQAVRILQPILDVQLSDVSRATATFRYQSDAQAARRLLLN